MTITDHNILLRKLYCYGVNGNALQLLKSYLTARTQRCYVNGVLSKEQYVSCGIPQGSILGPLLLIIYINDFPKCLRHTTPGMFADDTYSVGQSPIPIDYCQPLFLWLSRDWPSVRAYVRVYGLYRWGRGDYQKKGRGVSGVSCQVHIFYIGHSQYGQLTAVKTG